jgi:ParB family transcriptional regulator, chromosome partitioning protein
VTIPRRTGGLGRGLGALIPTGPADAPAGPTGTPAAGPAPQEVAGARFAELPVSRVSPTPLQPRQHFDEEAMAELVVSIREVGLLQPVVVREIDPDDGGPRYELVMGERRWRATQEAGLDTIPAIVRDTSDDDMLRDALLENLHRQQLNPLEEAAAYQQLLHEFGATHEELAARIGRSRPQISNTIRLLNLPAPVQRRVAAGVLSAGHARAILGLPTPEAMEAMAERVVAEGLSVRGVEEAVHLANAAGGGGKDEPAPAPRPGRRPVPAGLSELGERLSDRLETRVTVDLGRKRGKVTIEFATLDDLHRIVGIIEPQAGPALDGADDGRGGDGGHEGDHGGDGRGDHGGDGGDGHPGGQDDHGDHHGDHHHG